MGVIALHALAVGIHEHRHDVLDVLHFIGRAQPDFGKRVEPGRGSVDAGRLELDDAAAEIAGTPAGGERVVLTLDVVHDDRVRPRQQGRQDETDAFAGARRSEGEDVGRAVVAQIVARSLAVVPRADVDTVVGADEPRRPNLGRRRPVGRTVRVGAALHRALKARAEHDRNHQRDERADRGREPELVQDHRDARIGVHPERNRPLQAFPGRVDVRNQRCAERALKAEARRGQLGRDPEREGGQHEREAERADPAVERIGLLVTASGGGAVRLHGTMVASGASGQRRCCVRRASAGADARGRAAERYLRFCCWCWWGSTDQPLALS